VGECLTWIPVSQEGIPRGIRILGEGYRKVKEYQKPILRGIQHGIQKPQDWTKLYEIQQGDKKPPSV